MSNLFANKTFVIISVFIIVILYIINQLAGAPLSKVWSSIILDKSVREAKPLTEGVKGSKYSLNLLFEKYYGDMFYNTDKKETIVKASSHIQDAVPFLYKLNSKGDIIDSIDISAYQMISPDCILCDEDSFSTWSFTGDKTMYPFSKVEVWSDFRDKDEFTALLDAKYKDAKTACFWFVNGGNLMIMLGDGVSYQFIRMTRYNVWIDDDGTMDTGIKTYPPKAISSIIRFKKTEMQYMKSCKNNWVSLSIEHYTKHYRESFRLLSDNSLKWYGTAYYKLLFNGDVVRFKSELAKRYGEFGNNIAFYYLDPPYCDNPYTMMFMHMSENSYSRGSDGVEYHRADIGLYLLSEID